MWRGENLKAHLYDNVLVFDNVLKPKGHSVKGGNINGKDDISAQKEAARKSSRIPVQNGYQGRKKSSFRPQAQRQKADRSLTAEDCTEFNHHFAQFIRSGIRSGMNAGESCWVQHGSLFIIKKKNLKLESMESLKKNADFKYCYQNGKSYVNRHLVLYVCGNGMDRNRFGISVSKKVGNSVVRHRTTRLIREAVRLHEAEFAPGHDIVLVARVRAKEIGYFRMESALLHLIKKAGLCR